MPPAPMRRSALTALVPIAAFALVTAQARTPQAAVNDLLAADRAASAYAARAGMIEGITAMMAPDVSMPVPSRGFATGVEAVREALQRDTLNRTSRAEWTPLRGGISADGSHGFTYGYLTVIRADNSTVPGKYLAYWVNGASGWRVAAYRRIQRAPGAVDPTPLAPALPEAMVAPDRDAAKLAAHRESLMEAERSFAHESQAIGLRGGFAKYGSADAMNMGGAGTAGFVIGNTAIAELVSQGEAPGAGSAVNWGPERALVASSGDLGVTLGYITQNGAPQLPRFPFFTVWHRAPGQPWRYIAE